MSGLVRGGLFWRNGALVGYSSCQDCWPCGDFANVSSRGCHRCASVVVVLRVKALPDLVGADDDGVYMRHFLCGGVVEEPRTSSILVV